MVEVDLHRLHFFIASKTLGISCYDVLTVDAPFPLVKHTFWVSLELPEDMTFSIILSAPLWFITATSAFRRNTAIFKAFKTVLEEHLLSELANDRTYFYFTSRQQFQQCFSLLAYIYLPFACPHMPSWVLLFRTLAKRVVRTDFLRPRGYPA